MADPTERQLTTPEAAALEGTTASNTGIIYSTENENYVTKGIQQQATTQKILGLGNQLRVVKDATNPSLSVGVFSGRYGYGAKTRSYAGSTGNALTDDEDNRICILAESNALEISQDWPGEPHVKLALIGTGTNSIAGVSGSYAEVDIEDWRGSAAFSPMSGGIKEHMSQTLAIGDFTDNEDGTGYIDFDEDMPYKAIILGWKARVYTAFDGASTTTAVMELGIEGDTDAWSADTTRSVNAIGYDGSAPLAENAWVTSGSLTPRVTVTEDSDFGELTTGGMEVTIYYIDVSELDV